MRKQVGLLTVAVTLLLLPRTARAQEWVEGSTPDLGELVEVDATGEARWPHGSEDVAGDGLDDFTEAEQSIDLRTVYAQTSSTELWVRAYVVGQQVPPERLTLLIFVDADENRATGGSAAASSLEARLDDDPSDGGYEYVVVAVADGSAPRVYGWTPSASDYVELSVDVEPVAVETGVDIDPIRQGGVERGYVQVRIPLTDIDLSSICEARLFVRSVSDEPDLGPGDLSLGNDAQACRARDTDSDDIPDIAVPEDCTRDEQCPGDLICVSGECIATAEPTSCDWDGDCPDSFECVGGECVRSVTPCDTDDDCPAGFECVAGECVGPGAAGIAGNPNAIALPEGHEVQGGACNCSVPGRGPGPPQGALLLLAAGILRRLRARRSTLARVTES